MKNFNASHSLLALLLVPSFVFAAGPAAKPTPAPVAPVASASMISRLVRMPGSMVRGTVGLAVAALDKVAAVESPVVTPLVSWICSVHHQTKVKRVVAAATVAAAAYAVYNYTKNCKSCPFSKASCCPTAKN
jgi:hypothetical protein